MPQQIIEIFQAGGWVMYPLTLLSVVSLSLVLERGVYFLTAARASAASQLARAFPDVTKARTLAEGGNSLAHRFCRAMLESAGTNPVTDPDAMHALAVVRPELERFQATLPTIVTAAPLLGILGTVTGIIQSFGLLGVQETVTDPTQLAEGISEALYTTAFGLSIAIATLFPQAIIRAKARKALADLETIAIAAEKPQKTS